MCIPSIDRIVEIDGTEARTERAGSPRISLLCAPSAQVGDHVMIHAGYAIRILDAEEAAERRSMIASVTGLSTLTDRSRPTDDGLSTARDHS